MLIDWNGTWIRANYMGMWYSLFRQIYFELLRISENVNSMFLRYETTYVAYLVVIEERVIRVISIEFLTHDCIYEYNSSYATNRAKKYSWEVGGYTAGRTIDKNSASKSLVLKQEGKEHFVRMSTCKPAGDCLVGQFEVRHFHSTESSSELPVDSSWQALSEAIHESQRHFILLRCSEEKLCESDRLNNFTQWKMRRHTIHRNAEMRIYIARFLRYFYKWISWLISYPFTK